VQFDLSMHIYLNPILQQISLEYNTDLFDRADMERLMGHYLALMESAASEPDMPLARLQMLTPAEWKQIEAWNDTVAPYPADQTILSLFDEQVRRTPRQAAYLQGDVSLSYAELNARANQLARYLLQAGVAPGAPVGLCIKRSLEAVTALLAILKAGGTYVPLDPAYPLQRQEYMLKNSGVRVLVGMSATLEALAQLSERPIFLDREADAIAGQSTEDLPHHLSPESPLYILYTSGSTGQPKGVVGTHRAALNRFSWMWQVIPFEAGEVTCQKTALSFVDSVWELFGPLLRGTPSAIIPDEAVKDPAALVTELSMRKVTRIVVVPSLLRPFWIRRPTWSRNDRA
jgi:non-ribosomal peptide synthetase component F